MRLWHEALIPHLPRQQLLGQHRECCALRGNGWGKPHATVNYVFDHPYEYLYIYHLKVMKEMLNRGYQVNPIWYRMEYRGGIAPFITYYSVETKDSICGPGLVFEEFPRGSFKPNPDPYIVELAHKDVLVYPEHNDEYLKECLENLAGKGIMLEVTV